MIEGDSRSKRDAGKSDIFARNISGGDIGAGCILECSNPGYWLE